MKHIALMLLAASAIIYIAHQRDQIQTLTKEKITLEQKLKQQAKKNKPLAAKDSELYQCIMMAAQAFNEPDFQSTLEQSQPFILEVEFE